MSKIKIDYTLYNEDCSQVVTKFATRNDKKAIEVASLYLRGVGSDLYKNKFRKEGTGPKFVLVEDATDRDVVKLHLKRYHSFWVKRV